MMRQIYILSTLLFLFYSPLICQQEEFLQANNTYNASEYKQSIEQYEQILTNGNVSPDLYLNLGNAYFKNGELGKAILNYERGLKIDNGNKLLQQNLSYANKRIQVPITAIPDFFLSRYWEFVVTRSGSTGWAIIQLSLFVLIAIATAYWLLGLQLKTKKLAFYSLLFLIIVFLITILAGAQKYKTERNSNHGVIIKNNSALLTAASAQSEKLLDLSEGIKVRLIDRIQDHYKVQLMDKEVGWVSIVAIETI